VVVAIFAIVLATLYPEVRAWFVFQRLPNLKFISLICLTVIHGKSDYARQPTRNPFISFNLPPTIQCYILKQNVTRNHLTALPLDVRKSSAFPSTLPIISAAPPRFLDRSQKVNGESKTQNRNGSSFLFPRGYAA
jgi:hypothetical protein